MKQKLKDAFKKTRKETLMKGSFISLADGYRKVVSKKKVKLRHSKMNKLAPRVVVY